MKLKIRPAFRNISKKLSGKRVQNFNCIELFQEAVHNYPDKTALIHNGKSLSYLELSGYVNQVSNLMLSRSVKPGCFVGLFTERSLEMAIGYMAILNTGCTVVPLDTEDQSDRQRFILHDSNIEYILTQKDFEKKFAGENLQIIPLEIGDSSLSEFSIEKPELNIRLDNLALIIYTSGSSGHPKGVMLSHANLSHYVRSLQKTFNVTKNDTYLHRGSIALIVSARQLLMPLAIGATVVITTKEQAQDPMKFFSLAKQHGVTIIDHVPSFWRTAERFVATLKDHETASLFDCNVRLVMAGGEVVTNQIAKFWLKHFKKNTRFYNIYGQTEGTGVVSACSISRSDLDASSTIAIGEAINNMQIHILNRELVPVAAHETGEIYISGRGVAVGYLNQPELSAEKFFVLPRTDNQREHLNVYQTGDLGRYRHDGTIEFLGRMDNQVSIKGRRIDLNEIQCALSAHPHIEETQVIAMSDPLGEQILLAYFVSPSAAKPGPDEIRTFLLKKIPAYMAPSKYISLKSFPITTSGKIDRQALFSTKYTQLEFLHTNMAAPVTDLQSRLKTVWEEVLATGNISIHDDFFNLGGDSLKGLHLISEIEKSIGCFVPIEALYTFSTIERMADAIESYNDSKTNSASSSLTLQEHKTMLSIISSCGIPSQKPGSLVLKLHEQGNLPPLFWCFNAPGKEMTALAALLPDEQPLYGLLSSVPLENTQAALQKVAAHYVNELLDLYPEGPFILGGNCRGAKVICEMYTLLQNKNVSIDKICLLEFFHPCLYEFTGDLMLLFGKYSHLKRHELLKWKQKDWKKPFISIPDVYWIRCKHGKFFNKPNSNKLAKRIKQLLYT